MKKPLSIIAGIMFLAFSSFALFFSVVWILESLNVIAAAENGVTNAIGEMLTDLALYTYIAFAVVQFLGFEFAFGMISCGANAKRYKKKRWKVIFALVLTLLDLFVIGFLTYKLWATDYKILLIVCDVILVLIFVFALVDVVKIKSYVVEEERKTTGGDEEIEEVLRAADLAKEPEKEPEVKAEPVKQEPVAAAQETATTTKEEAMQNVSELERRINDIMELGAKQDAELKAIDEKKEKEKEKAAQEPIDVVLARYIKMRDSGAISDKEYEELKQSLIEKEKKVD